MPFPDTPLVDVIIPVHTTRRPVGRAVASVVAGGLPISERGGVRITVVCHNISAALIRDRLAEEHRGLVDLLEYSDGTNSPAGARNLALERSSARYVSFLDSDDTFAPGALAVWPPPAAPRGSTAVLPPLVNGPGVRVRTPVPRPGRRSALDPVRDRLAYRTHAFGLLRREAVLRHGARFNSRYVTGEDQEIVARTWFGGGRIDLAPREAAYVLHEDAADRISGGPRPLAEDLAAATDLLAGSWFAGLDTPERTAIAAKVLRVQLFAGIQARAPLWTETDRAACQAFIALVASVAAPAIEVLSRADRQLLDVALGAATQAAEVTAASARRRRFGFPGTLVTRNLRRVLHREAPVRFMVASMMV